MKSLAILLGLALSSGNPVSYDCQAEQQILVMSDKGDWSYSGDAVDRESRETFRWMFVVSRGPDGTTSVSHAPSIIDALGVGGTYTATEIAPGQFAFATTKDENCLMTELGCGALVEISDIDDRNASFSISPMGSVKMEDGRREIMQLIMVGTCKKSELK